MRTPQMVLAPIGTDQPAISIPGTDQIRGALIDNPSGSWLLIQPGNTYIAPYTIGVALTFPGGITSLSVLYGDGPAGQVSTLQGDPPVIQLDTQPVEPSAGTASGAAFIAGFTPQLTRWTGRQICTVSAGYNATLLAAIPNKRYRILYASLFDFSIDGLWQGDASLFARIDGGLTVTIGLVLTPEKGQHSITFPKGLDCEVGAAVTIDGQAPWADVAFGAQIVYEIV